jgi:hypothetical protein
MHISRTPFAGNVTFYFNYSCTLPGKKLSIFHYRYKVYIGIVQFEGKQHSSNNQQMLHHGGAITHTANRPWQISHPHPREPRGQGLDEGSGDGFYSVMPTSQRKKLTA